MIDWLLEVLSGISLVTGGVLVVIGSVGLLRFPDFFTRIHAAGITDTLGAALVIFGLAIKSGFALVTFKLLLFLALLLFTSPTATHALARAARHGKLRPLLPPKGERS